MGIEDYRFGRIRIDGRTYSSDVIIWPEGVDDTWWRQEGHSLCEADLEPALDKDPDVLVIGTGANSRMSVPSGVEDFMREHAGEVHVQPTAQAVQTYNNLSGGDRRVVAALHLTC